ncbi:MAG: DEAD/DEAH box helicase [Candidatus Omnitrophota bacterium]
MPQRYQQSSGSFYGLGIAPKILEALDRMQFTVPTPIQHKAIPIAIEGKDVIGVAQTGTGKTLAFAIPIIQRLAQAKGRCLILVPTRELALQVDETFQKLAPLFGMRTAVLIGGASMGLQLSNLRKNPRIIIATPGRLVDHIDQRTVLLADVTILVLDEADRMLDMGFLPQIERILKRIPSQRQSMLFSATIPKEIISIAAAYMKLPIHIEIAPSGTTAERIIQELFIVKKDAKRQLLGKLLRQYQGSVLLFSRTKIGAVKITRFLRMGGHSAAEIHSNRSLPQRREALEGFKSGKYRVLVATDIAARGIDVTGIELVINYDLPEDSENYVHRIGRTGRAGQEGRAISFATPDQEFDVRSIEKLIKTTLPISEHPELPRERFSKNPAQPADHHRQSTTHHRRHFGSSAYHRNYRRAYRPS